MGRICVVLFLLVSWSGAARANPTDANTAEDNVVQWYVYSAPPISINSGQNRGRGWADKRLQIVSKRLIKFRHETIEASVARLVEDIKTKPNVCNTGLLKTPEREAFIEFSEPFSPILPNGAIVPRARYAQIKPFLDENGYLRLDALLKSGKFRLGIIAGRTYGKGIDEVIKKYTGQPAVVVVPSSNYSPGLLLKLAGQNEYDVAPVYAVEMRYLSSEASIDEKDYVYMTVAEQPTLVPTYVGCSKTEFGKRVIAEVNKLLADEQVKKDDAAAYKFWLDDATAAHYDRLRKQASNK